MSLVPMCSRTVTVRAGNSAVNGWTVTWNWPGSQSITQLWGGVRSGAAPSVSVRNESWNGRLAAAVQGGWAGPVTSRRTARRTPPRARSG
ncbi:cellulose binding domain-containing protein [Nonomuraea angiospora]|uniref:cellulose binding domain-containing protein n=1 Tax=Nonomuraea angiospora TaxID=46172 RepID=UPI00344F87A5